MKSLALVCLFVFFADCGGAVSSGRQNENDIIDSEPIAQTPVEETLAEKFGPLLALWVEENIDSSGLRRALSLTLSSDGTNVGARYYQVDLQGQDAGGLQGEAFLEERELILDFGVGEVIQEAYDVSGSALAFGDMAFVKVESVGPITGSGTVSGKIIFPNGPSEDSSPQQQFIPGQILVVPEDPSNSQIAALIRKDPEVEVTEGIPGLALLVENKNQASIMGDLTEPDLALSERLSRVITLRQWTLDKIKSYKDDPSFKQVQPNYLYRPLRVPDDLHYSLQWHYPLINLPEAWEITTGRDDLVMAVVDTGARFDHPDLGSRLTNTGYDFITNPSNANDGDGRDPDPSDDATNNYHGSHVAGTMGAVTDNALGVAGVTWKGQLMPVRALGRSGGTSVDVTNAMLYAAGLPNSSGLLPEEKASVINCSFGGYSSGAVEGQAVNRIIQQGVVIVASSGNGATYSPLYPASHPGVISVAAVGSDGLRASYSNMGPRLDLAAPGGSTGFDRNEDGYADGVLSSVWQNSEDRPVYKFYQGTSMASPHVAGIVGLMQSVNPDLPPVQILQILKDTAVDIGDPGEDDFYGAGLVNAEEAVRTAQTTSPLPPGLELSTETVALGSGNKTGEVWLSNAGGGVVTGLNLLIAPVTGGPWLTAELDDTTVPTRLRLTAETQALTPGGYESRIRLSSSSGDKEIVVTLAVDTREIGVVRVMARDVSTGQIVASVAADPGFNYVFPQLPVGHYEIIASSDFDDDGVFCGDDEWVGSTAFDPEATGVLILPDAVVTDRNISLHADHPQIQSCLP